MAASTYTLISWMPAHFDPRRADAEPEKGAERQRTINAPNDEAALKEAEKILPELGGIGSRDTQGSRGSPGRLLLRYPLNVESCVG